MQSYVPTRGVVRRRVRGRNTLEPARSCPSPSRNPCLRNAQKWRACARLTILVQTTAYFKQSCSMLAYNYTSLVRSCTGHALDIGLGAVLPGPEAPRRSPGPTWTCASNSSLLLQLYDV
eukprot:6214107-Pleurochrysis_carterae.AAC.3